MNFKELDYIMCIAKHQNITKASKELFISQPSLSKYLMNLENVSGIKFFSRTGKKFMLTYAGERYIHYAKQMLLLKKDLDDELTDIAKFDRGRLRIAFPAIRGSYMLPETLPKFMEKYPNVEVVLHEHPSEILEKLILNNEVDIAIFNHPIRDAGLDYEVLGNEEIILVVSKDNELSKKGIQKTGSIFPWIDIRLISDEKFILNMHDQRTGQIARQIFASKKLNPQIIIETRSIEGAVRLAASNFGVCFVNETHLKYFYLKEKPVCFSIGEPTIAVQLVAAYRKGAYLPQYTQDYIKIVKSCL